MPDPGCGLLARSRFSSTVVEGPRSGASGEVAAGRAPRWTTTSPRRDALTFTLVPVCGRAPAPAADSTLTPQLYAAHSSTACRTRPSRSCRPLVLHPGSRLESRGGWFRSAPVHRASTTPAVHRPMTRLHRRGPRLRDPSAQHRDVRSSIITDILRARSGRPCVHVRAQPSRRGLKSGYASAEYTHTLRTPRRSVAAQPHRADGGASTPTALDAGRIAATRRFSPTQLSVLERPPPPQLRRRARVIASARRSVVTYQWFKQARHVYLLFSGPTSPGKPN
jgi:hypothetical protein